MIAGRQASGPLELVEGLGAVLLWLSLAPIARRTETAFAPAARTEGA